MALVEGISARLYPLPTGIDYSDRNAIAAAIGSLPLGALMIVVVAWALGALAGACTAVYVGRHRVLGILVGVVLLAGAVGNLLAIPHPGWMWIAALVAISAATLGGTRMAAGTT